MVKITTKTDMEFPFPLALSGSYGGLNRINVHDLYSWFAFMVCVHGLCSWFILFIRPCALAYVSFSAPKHVLLFSMILVIF